MGDVKLCCGHCISAKEGAIPKDDPLQEHYKKGGMMGALTGMFGDKKTLYCHHVTATGEFGTKKAAGRKFGSVEEVWEFLGKKCQGRYAYDRASGELKCGELVKGDHDNTCNIHTCLFVANGLPCPTPSWAHK